MSKIKSLKEVWKKYKYLLTTSQKRWGVVVIILTLVGAVCETMGVSIILPLVQVMITPQELRCNDFFAPIIMALGIESDKDLIWSIGISVIIVYVFKNIYLTFLSYFRVKYACKVQRELSIEMLESYIKRGYVFFLNSGTGELLRGILSGISNTYTGLYQIFRLFAEIMTILFICIYIMISDFAMAVCVIILAIICLMIVVFGCQKWVKKCGEIFYKYTALINQSLIQTFQGIKEILVMNRQEFFIETYRKQYQKQQKGFIGQTVASESPAYIIEGVCVAGLIVSVCFKAINTENAAAMVPELASFAVAAFRILPSLGRISMYFNQFMFCLPGINDTYDNFKEVRDNLDNKDVKCYTIEKKELFKKNIDVSDVVWKYPDAAENVLENINLEIEKGQSIAFVGKSGSGKTTLADVILGLLVPQGGCVKIDGVDIREIKEKQIFGFVPQIVNLLDDNVRRNVAFGLEDDEIEDEKVWNALKKAQLDEIIREYETGLDTEIGERGVHFSGGQRQRFAIARALYNDPDILVLDEATSALDTETETAVMEAIDSLHGQKTLIIIAHRLTTIRNCDKIYEVANGQVTEKTYEELV